MRAAPQHSFDFLTKTLLNMVNNKGKVIMFGNFFAALRRNLNIKTVAEVEYAYLCEAENNIDLERRMQQIDQGLFRNTRCFY